MSESVGWYAGIVIEGRGCDLNYQSYGLQPALGHTNTGKNCARTILSSPDKPAIVITSSADLWTVCGKARFTLVSPEDSSMTKLGPMSDRSMMFSIVYAGSPKHLPV